MIVIASPQVCTCGRCNDEDDDTMSEMLIDLAWSVEHPRDLIITTKRLPSDTIARIKLAILWAKKPPAIHLRAMMENWDLPRIVQEVYV